MPADVMTPWALGQSFYGLKSLGDSPETSALIAELTPKVSPDLKFAVCILGFVFGEFCIRDFAQTFGDFASAHKTDTGQANCAHDFRNLGCPYPLALAPQVRGCRGAFTARTVSNALYGLQSLRDGPEVRRLPRCV